MDGGIEAAVEWARQRAPYVLVCDGPWRFGYLSAGDQDPAGLDLPRWLGLTELAERLREGGPPPGAPHQTGWVTVFDNEAKSFPIPDDVEPAGGLPGQPGESPAS